MAARTPPPAAMAAPIDDLAVLQCRLNAALVAGEPTASIRAQIAAAAAEAEQRAAAATAADRAARQALDQSVATAAAAHAAGARAALVNRLAALQPPPAPFSVT